MNILQIVPELNSGGVERTTLEIAEALFKQGFTPHICSQGGRLEPEFVELGAKLHCLNIGSKNPLKYSAHKKALIKIIKDEKIDLIHARSRAPAWPAYAAARAAGRPFVTTYHGIYNASSRLKRHYNAIMAKGDLVIANSEYTKSHIIKEHRLDPGKIRVIPRGVDMALFDPKTVYPEDIKKLRNSWDVGTDEKAILLPGRLTRWKGQLVAIRALAALPIACKLILLGDAQDRTAYQAEIKKLAANLGIVQQIVMPGHFSNVPLALMAADIVIAPSIKPEAFGRVVTEAQAMGRPVIASNHGGPMETIISEKTGFLVDPNDNLLLAHAIKRGLNWPAYDPKFARDHVRQKYSKKQLQTKTLEVYSELLM
ncbi:MAG: glycosyltransferase family 4 protein [Hellea sp.]|nr:glycosyltransferase family 4 protein [Hellea sp.]